MVNADTTDGSQRRVIRAPFYFGKNGVFQGIDLPVQAMHHRLGHLQGELLLIEQRQGVDGLRRPAFDVVAADTRTQSGSQCGHDSGEFIGQTFLIHHPVVLIEHNHTLWLECRSIPVDSSCVGLLVVGRFVRMPIQTIVPAGGRRLGLDDYQVLPFAFPRLHGTDSGLSRHPIPVHRSGHVGRISVEVGNPRFTPSRFRSFCPAILARYHGHRFAIH